MRMVLKVIGAPLLILVLAATGVYAWASMKSSQILSRTFEIHAFDFPIPFPLSEEERSVLGLDESEARQVAMQRAMERGRHLVASRHGCAECHGSDFSGGVMVDNRTIGRLLGPNLTSGSGTRTAGFGPADRDRIVRHGVNADGTPSAMP